MLMKQNKIENKKYRVLTEKTLTYETDSEKQEDSVLRERYNREKQKEENFIKLHFLLTF